MFLNTRQISPSKSRVFKGPCRATATAHEGLGTTTVPQASATRDRGTTNTREHVSNHNLSTVEKSGLPLHGTPVPQGCVEENILPPSPSSERTSSRPAHKAYSLAHVNSNQGSYLPGVRTAEEPGMSNFDMYDQRSFLINSRRAVKKRS